MIFSIYFFNLEYQIIVKPILNIQLWVEPIIIKQSSANMVYRSVLLNFVFCVYETAAITILNVFHPEYPLGDIQKVLNRA